MQENKYRFYFDKQLAEYIAAQYQHLVGKKFPVTLGVSAIEVPIDSLVVQHIENDAYDIVLFSKLDDIEFREIYMVLNLYNYRLLDYLELIGERFPFERYGIGFTQLLPERDEDGIDLFL